MELIKISVVIVTHNRLECLKRAYKSVLGQQFVPYEIILVDDASTDGTYDYCLSIDKPGVRYIRIDKHESRGANHARNIGVAASNGDYVAFLDDDDEWLPQKLLRQVEVIEADPQCNIVGCGRVLSYDDKREYYDELNLLPRGDLHLYVLHAIPYITSTLLIKRELLSGNEQFDERLRYWQEYELEMRLFQKHYVGCANENLVIYHIDSKNKKRTTNSMDGWDENLDYIESKHFDLISNAPEEIRQKRRIMIANDAAMRAENLNNKKLEHDHLKYVFTHNRSIRNLARLVLNISDLRRLSIYYVYYRISHSLFN